MRRYVFALFLVVAGAAGGAALGIRWATPELETLARHNRVLENELQRLGRQLEAARARAAVATREAEVVRDANALLRADEAGRQAEMNRLRGELELYQRLGGATGDQPPLSVRHAEIEVDNEGDPRLLALTLTQNLRFASEIEGAADLAVTGLGPDGPATLGPAELGVDTDALAFAFKYFQLLEVPLALPPGFTPETLEVRLEADDGAHHENRFEWATLLPGYRPPRSTRND